MHFLLYINGLQAFFREKGPQSICEKRLQLMEELCQKLPEGDLAHQTLETARKDFAEVREEIENTHQKLMQHQDKWKEYNKRCNNVIKLVIVIHFFQCKHFL